MLSQILNILKLKKELPDLVGYDQTTDLTNYTVPIEILKELPKELADSLTAMTAFHFRVDNYSPKAQRNIRILYSGNYQYSPQLVFQRRDIEVKYISNEDDKELIISEIPPNDTVYINLFNTDNDFEIEQVLIGDNKITQLMRKLTMTKVYPELKWISYISCIIFPITIATLIWAGYEIMQRNKTNNIITTAYSDFLSCSPYVFENPPEAVNKLNRKFYQLDPFWQKYILSSNKVLTFDELKNLDQIILCTPSQP